MKIEFYSEEKISKDFKREALKFTEDVKNKVLEEIIAFCNFTSFEYEEFRVALKF